MASIVAQKPSDNSTPGQMIAMGSDPAAFDDYLNLELFGAPPSASRASQSPASSHGALPVTPNANDQQASSSPRSLFPALEASPNAGLTFLDSYTPLDKNFGAFPDLSMIPGSSMDLSMGTGLDQYNNLFQDMFAGFADPGPSNTDPLFGAPPAASPPTIASAPIPSSAIDPQLFSAPTPSSAPAAAPTPLSAPRMPSPESDDDHSDEDESLQEDDEVAPLPSVSGRSATSRRNRKNAAAAGGITKRSSRASTPASHLLFDDPKPVIPPVLGKGGVASYLNGERIGSQEPDEWRPTPEEYKKLSSKEKRQLRNKISARNFRVRRKEYITTLESHIADRDQLISAIRSELRVTHDENTELRREIDALKRAIQEGRIDAANIGLPDPRPLTPESKKTHRQPISRPNTKKDQGFWGGAIGNGGVTSVHRMVVPDFPTTQPLLEKPMPISPPSSTGPLTPPPESVNMNPLLNLSPLLVSSKLPGSPAANVGLDIMGDAFNQRTLDGFRAQLWGRMAKEAGARSVGRERRDSPMEDATAVEPLDSTMSESSGSSSSVPSSSGSPQQTTSSESSPQLASSSGPTTPPQPAVSSSPSLSMLHSPSGILSLWDSPLSQPQPQPSSTPSLFQASIFGAGFGTGRPAQSVFSQQNTSSAQARAMLQAQWLALQQSRQMAASTPNVMTEIQNQAAQTQPQSAVTPGQREAYLAQFAQAVAAQQAQQQQQQAVGGLAKEVRPAYFTSDKAKSPVVEKPKTGIVEKIKASTAANSSEKKGTTPQQAALFATIASQTLLQRMGGAFWDAFSGSGAKAGGVDTDKVRKVLEGKAVVRVVDVEKDMDSLEERMKSLNVGTTSTSAPLCPTAGGLDMFSNLRGKK